MKTMIATLALTLIGFQASAFATGEEENKVAQVAQEMGLEIEAIEDIFIPEGNLVKIYNDQDELVAEGKLNAFGEATDEKLAASMHGAQLLMTLGNTEIYRAK